jgi:hypothetical protein
MRGNKMKINEITEDIANTVVKREIPEISAERLLKFQVIGQHKEVFSPENVLKLIDEIYQGKY